MINDIIFDIDERQFKEVIYTTHARGNTIYQTKDGSIYYIGGGNEFRFITSDEAVELLNEFVKNLSK